MRLLPRTMVTMATAPDEPPFTSGSGAPPDPSARSAPRSDVPPVSGDLEEGRRHAAETLFPLLYEELRQLAESRLSRERSGGTLQATALVHEAYLRLAGDTGAGSARRWDGRGHFFAAAATAMRRILVERARARGRLKRGGDRERVDLDDLAIGVENESVDILALDAALTKLVEKDARKHDVVMLRFFAGLSIDRAAEELGVAAATVERDWMFAKAWLFRELGGAAVDDRHAS